MDLQCAGTPGFVVSDTNAAHTVRVHTAPTLYWVLDGKDTFTTLQPVLKKLA